MYIRRKVFSSFVDENGEEKMFSTTEFVNEEDYLQKEFGISSKLAKAGKKISKEVRRNIEDVKTGFKMGAGKDLTAKEVEKIAAKERLAHQKYKKGEISNLRIKLAEKATGKQISEEALAKNREFWENKARNGSGAVAIIPGRYM